VADQSGTQRWTDLGVLYSQRRRTPKCTTARYKHIKPTHTQRTAVSGAHAPSTSTTLQRVVRFAMRFFVALHRQSTRTAFPLSFRTFLGGSGCAAAEFVKTRHLQPHTWKFDGTPRVLDTRSRGYPPLSMSLVIQKNTLPKGTVRKGHS
jgi:hypothetical protein